MPVFHLNSLPKQKRIQMIAEFYDVISSLKDRNEVRLFFKDLLEVDEIAMLMRRVEIVVLLAAGFTYKEISNLIGVGGQKIAKAHKKLQQDDSGYRIVVQRLIENRKRHLKKMKKSEREAMSPLRLAKKKHVGILVLDHILDAALEKLDGPELQEEAILFTLPTHHLRIENQNKTLPRVGAWKCLVGGETIGTAL